MDSQQIRLSALGRDVEVGNLYNYYDDSTLSSDVKVSQDCISVDKKSSSEAQWFYLPQVDHLKHDVLGINAHLRHSIKCGAINLSQLWFADFLQSNQSKEDSNVAQVTFFFRVVRRTETLDPKFFESKLNEYQLQSGGRATHLVEQVVYGAEFLCSMRRTFNLQQFKKSKVEAFLCWTAKEYLNQIFGRNSVSPDWSAALNNVTCLILSSLDVGNKLEGSCVESIKYLRDALSFNKDDRVEKWKPIKITLRNIPEQIEARLQSERKSDIILRRERHEVTWKLIQTKSRSILKIPLLHRVPLFKEEICQFNNLLSPLWEKIKEFYEIFEATTSEQILKETYISKLLNDMIDWLIYRHIEIERMLGLIKRTGTQSIVENWAEIKTSKIPNQTKLFVMHAECNQNSVVESIQKYIGTYSVPVPPLIVLPILFTDKDRFEKMRKELLTMAERKQSNHSDLSKPCISYHVRLATEDPFLTDYLITIIGNYKQLLAKKQRSNSFLKQRDYEMNTPDTRDYQSAEQRGNSIKVNYAVLPVASEPNTEMKIVCHQPSKSPSKVYQENGLNQPEEEGRGRVENTKSESLVDCIQNCCSVGVKLDENENCINELPNDDAGNKSDGPYWNSSTFTYHRDFSQSTRKTDCAIEMPLTVNIENDLLNNQRIAEFFADEKNQCAQLIRQGQPNIYLLNATDKWVSGDLRWFDFGQLNYPPPFGYKNHKVIILMGATGCGKSTLINGMVNYILGVKWNDPFRFKCVREDETVAENQAISQTSSVTAYTLHHDEKMTIPYSITIVDTPGYGDTRGVQRDKEITRNIQQFLTGQEFRIEEIHAACFVASSGDSRLTTTQRYIIDSALSIFGKDMKENIRLLVTFADNADPPVVEACRAANFPVTSASAGITYSKFNSSVLYAFNQQSGEDDLGFDELFWDMGQENFSKFFTMLEGMKGRNLESTREVIRRRHLLEQSLSLIEQELEVCLFNIENAEKFQRKMKECSQKMETNKNFVIEKMKMSYIRVPCENGFYVYNCSECQKTCDDQLIHRADAEKRRKNKKNCKHIACPHSPKEHDYESFIFRPALEKEKHTFLDLKAKYDSNVSEKVINEQLLADCSDKLNIAKAKVFSLLEQVGESVSSLESTALRSNTLSPSDYLSLMKSRVAEEQAPGYEIRLETLSELQKSFSNDEEIQQPCRAKQTFQPESPSIRGSRGRGIWNGPNPSTKYCNET